MNNDFSPRYLVGATLFIILFIAAVVFLVTYRSETKARATAFSWERKIDIQQWETVEESDWQIPLEGRYVREYSAYHHSVLLPTGTTCSGKPKVCTTTYTSFPVYRTKYDYQIERWMVDRTPALQGFDQKPTWPDVTDLPLLHSPPQIGDERPGTRYSRYTVEFKNKDVTYHLDITEERWKKVGIERSYTIILNIFGQPMDFKDS